MLVKITNNFYQLTDVFSNTTLNDLVSIFDGVDKSWLGRPGGEFDSGLMERLQYPNMLEHNIILSIHKELIPAFDLAEKILNTKIYQNSPQLWYDCNGYINPIHDCDISPNMAVNIQIYLCDGAENMGTWAFDEGEWHSVPYRKNCGYMLIGATHTPHGMKHAVTNKRMSLYQTNRITEIPSDIW
jgi:hypothetical protein